MQSKPMRATILRFLPIVLLPLLALAAPAAAAASQAAGDIDVEASRKPPYSEVPGKLEFSGVLVARPVQFSQAAALDLSADAASEAIS